MIEYFLACCLCTQEATVEQPPLTFSITHDGALDESLTGRVYVMLTRGRLPLLGGPNWFKPEPFLRHWTLMVGKLPSRL